MKTASVQQVPQQWPEILRWVAASEEVQVAQQDQVVARVVPLPSQRPLLISSRGRGLGRYADPNPEVFEFDRDLPGLELCGSEIVDLHGEQRVAEHDAWSGVLAARPS